jgi:DNA repair photolyase
MNVRFPKLRLTDWTRPVLRAHALRKTWRLCKQPTVVMFPTSHDITMENALEYVIVLRKMLQSGRHVLIVTKPHLRCVRFICDKTEDYKKQILFRFSLGSLDDAMLKRFEPGAPDSNERLASVCWAHNAGFQTSVSAEPLLGGLQTAQDILSACLPYVTQDVWIGKLNYISRFRTPELDPYLRDIEAAQTDEALRAMAQALAHIPNVAWKDSIKKVLSGTQKMCKILPACP